jgi:hypothetical protein
MGPVTFVSQDIQGIVESRRKRLVIVAIKRLELDISDYLEFGIEQGEPCFGPAYVNADVTSLRHEETSARPGYATGRWLRALPLVFFAIVFAFFRLVGLLLLSLPGILLLLTTLRRLSMRLLAVRLLRILLLFSRLMALFLLALFHRILFKLIFLFHELYSFLSCWLYIQQGFDHRRNKF